MELISGEFRLPTEAQWEYACRAGTTTRFYWGDDPYYMQIGEYAWYDLRRDSDVPRGAQEVGQKIPNAWGLYDMSGNVWEWCLDWHGEYPTGPVVDPIGPETGQSRVTRGGFWSSLAQDCRSAARGAHTVDPRAPAGDGGLRLVKTP